MTRVVIPHGEFVDFSDDMLPMIIEAIDMGFARNGDAQLRVGPPVFLQAVDYVTDAEGKRYDVPCWLFEVPTILVA